MAQIKSGLVILGLADKIWSVIDRLVLLKYLRERKEIVSPFWTIIIFLNGGSWARNGFEAEGFGATGTG